MIYPILADAAQTEPSMVGIVAFFTLLGGVVGWILSSLKNAADIRKLKSETANNIATFIVRIQDRHQEYVDACVQCGNLARKINHEIKGQQDLTKLCTLREQLSHVFLNTAVVKLHQYIELECERYKKKQSDLRDILDHVLISDIRKFTSWIEVINHPNLLSHLHVNAARIDRGWVDPFYRHAQHVGHRRRRQYHERIKAELEKFLKSAGAGY